MAAKPPKVAKRFENTKSAVLIATSNLFVEPEIVDSEFAANLFFEDISGNELINIQPYNFLVNTENSNISNINSIVTSYEPQSLFKSSNIQPSYFARFEISLNDKTPLVGSGPSGENVSFVAGTVNSVYIELINTLDDEEVQIEFLGKATPIGDTID
jgi:hypothetical protein